MLDFDAASGATLLPAWGAGVIAAIALALAATAWRRDGVGALVARIAAVTVAVLAAGVAGLAGSAVMERLAQRRALEQRLADLSGRALVPGSPLACLDGLAGTAAEPACQAALLARPETAAAAVTFVTAQLTLLFDAAPVATTDNAVAQALAPLRRALADDRFGLVAHVLALRAGCTPEFCSPLGLLDRPDRVRANLRDRPFDAMLALHAASWPNTPALPTPSSPVSSVPGPGLAGTGHPAGVGQGAGQSAGPIQPGTGQPTGQPVSSRYDFPSAASIPPVSIMAPEPAGPPPAAAARELPAPVPASPGAAPPGAAAAQAAPAPPARKPAPAPPARTTPQRPPAAKPVPAAPPAPAAGSDD